MLLITLIPFKNHEIAQQFNCADEFIFIDERGNIEAEINAASSLTGLDPLHEQRLAELIGAFSSCRVLVKEITLSCALLLEEHGATICKIDDSIRFLHQLHSSSHKQPQ
ncbi:hypothetical Protein YC6258_05609 [Gynuella sunshinyii YC6258]|uniref:Dinitrogenase iron-molybdenum cofactor biosynthesis domain-containing protein n=1 Tax=Gynuella sunshinyii YC6258 TaxID=1445510 RepID=A0A0C5VSG8_9GAMM|nr:hypothetical Protein YC6258_05609 [Gynuella sunshinyii YC6258]